MRKGFKHNLRLVAIIIVGSRSQPYFIFAIKIVAANKHEIILEIIIGAALSNIP